MLCQMQVRVSVPRSPWRHAIDGSISGKIKLAQALAIQHSDHSQKQEPCQEMYTLNHSHIPACTMFSTCTSHIISKNSSEARIE